MHAVKKVVILYRSPQAVSNTGVIQFIKNNLEEIFGDRLLVENCFLADLNDQNKLEADAFLAIDERVFQRAKEYVDNFHSVIKINRTIEQDVLKRLLDIPAGTNVLIVNDSYSTAVDTINGFFEMGISHINMIAYDRKLAHTGIYDYLTVAVTPAERQFVPAHIKEIIDIGYRKISFDTMFRLMKSLNLDISVVNRNLFRYIHTLAAPDAIFHTNYVNEYLKSEALHKIANTSQSGILLIDNAGKVIYANDKSKEITKSRGNEYDLSFLQDQDDRYDSHPIKLMEETVGYYITIHEESKLSLGEKTNHKKGHVAKHHFQNIIFCSEEMKNAVQTAEQMVQSEHTVLIYGESGTGKELFAQSIHNASPRKRKPFVAVNCAALPENLLESELFGYEAGAFTGANAKGKIGLFEQANHGTIFLDEIGDVTPNLQARLLRTIQEKQIMRIGSDRIIDIDVRLITATNKDLMLEVQEGHFRSDLFYRLNVLPIRIPPLRARMQDVIPLLHHFLGDKYNDLTPQEIDHLTTYQWPGNVREVENFCTYYKTLNAFPDYILTEKSKAAKKTPVSSIQKKTLEIIADSTEISHGIGRNALLHMLNDMGFSLSDRALRIILEQLQKDALIQIGLGRAGTRITENGIKVLADDAL